MAESNSSRKIVTLNFKDLHMFEDSKEFAAWRESVDAKIVYDRRNSIYCCNPTMDYEMYYNYMKFLNSRRTEWKSAGYFDMGLVPYIMWPSFMDNSPVMEQMRTVARQCGVNLVSVPAVSLLKQGGNGGIGYDYWIFREDLFSLAKWMEQISPVYSFNMKSADDATLSAFLEPLAQISIAHR